MSALAGLDTSGRGLMFLMSFIFGVECTECTLYLQNKFCVKGKSLYFNRRFEFPACAKLVRITITNDHRSKFSNLRNWKEEA